MPRNPAGTYSLPAGNPVVTGTIIQSAWANDTMGDLGTSVTNSLARDGRGGMLAPLKLTVGSAGSPSQTFTTDPNTGRFLAAMGDMQDVVAGVPVVRYLATGVEFWDGVKWVPVSDTIDAVQSVNGFVGVVVLTTADIAELTNLYYTEARVSANASVVLNTAKISYPPADASKLAGIEAGAEVNTINSGDNVSLLVNDVPYLTSIPPDLVTSVNGQQGVVVLVTADIAELTNLYYTEARVSANASVVLNTAKRSYPQADEDKLALIEDGAEVNTINSGDNVSLLVNDVPYLTSIPPDLVTSVNGQQGVVVLTTADIAELTNLYYTESRVSANSSVVANTAKNTYPPADASKLAGIEAGAEVNTVDSVNGEVGVVVLDAADVGAAPSSHVGSTGVANHGLATIAIDGFMAATDKAILDALNGAVGDYVLKAGDTMTGTLEINSGAGLVAEIILQSDTTPVNLQNMTNGRFRVLLNNSTEVAIAAYVDGGVELYFNSTKKIETETYGALTIGQHRVSGAAPVASSDLTRKDYVDNAIAAALPTAYTPETLTATAGQTVFVYTVAVTNVGVYLNGLNVDVGRLLAGVDYTLSNSDLTVTLSESLPAGTSVTAQS